MKKVKTSKHDKILAPPPVTGDIGTSTSSNITIASSGMTGDDSHSLFPDFHENKNWSSKTNSIRDAQDQS